MTDYTNRKFDEPIARPLGADTPDITQNRGFDTKSDENTQNPISVTLLTIDDTLITYLNNRIKPLVMQDGKQIKVPVIYGSPERWKSVQRDGVLRDIKGKIQLPIIMISRTSMKKNSKVNSSINKHIEREFETGWNKYSPYDRYALLNGIQPPRQKVVTVTPDYFILTYECLVWTEYMEQMNTLIEHISFEDDEYWGDRGKYKFRTSINDYKMQNSLPNTQDRLIRTTFNLTVAAYLLPERTIDDFGRIARTTKNRFTIKKEVVFTELDP